jgi:acyl-CoA synthetase (AMP-forming)/AMP-acid ligase II
MRPVPEWGTIPAMLRAQAAEHPDAEVVADGTTRLTIGELAGAAGEVARALLAAGIRPGDRVAVWAPNGWRWAVAAFGIWDVGGVIVPLSTRFKGAEAAGILATSGARLLLVAGEFLGVSYLDLLADFDLPELERTVVLGGDGWDEFLTAGATVHPDESERRADAVAPGYLAEILATSGTTGTPKGVMIDHGQLLRGYWDWSEVVTLGPGDRYPIVAPFSHGFGINAGLLACVLRRATMLPIAAFDPAAALALIGRERVSVLAGPPALFDRLLGSPDLDRYDLGSLRVAIVGAASVPTGLVHRMRARFDRVINAYGLIEGTVVSMTRADDPAETIATTAGRPMPGVEVRIAGEPEESGGRGEVLIRGYGVMRGYWRAPELTAAAVDPDGWLHTGDIGVLDAAGNLAIVDRKKDLFIVGGFNAYPAEIENLLLRHPSVGQVAVIGVPDDALGEVGWAHVVPAPETVVDPAKLIAWAREAMSNYKVPRRIVVVDALPVNANGKVDKNALRAQRSATAVR